MVPGYRTGCSRFLLGVLSTINHRPFIYNPFRCVTSHACFGYLLACSVDSPHSPNVASPDAGSKPMIDEGKVHLRRRPTRGPDTRRPEFSWIEAPHAREASCFIYLKCEINMWQRVACLGWIVSGQETGDSPVAPPCFGFSHHVFGSCRCKSSRSRRCTRLTTIPDHKMSRGEAEVDVAPVPPYNI